MDAGRGQRWSGIMAQCDCNVRAHTMVDTNLTTSDRAGPATGGAVAVPARTHTALPHCITLRSVQCACAGPPRSASRVSFRVCAGQRGARFELLLLLLLLLELDVLEWDALFSGCGGIRRDE